MNEKWKQVKGHEYYEVSNLGKARSYNMTGAGHKRRKIPVILRPGKTRGYTTYSFNGKTYRAHRVVAIHFIPNPENKPQVNHINGNKSDNRAENLEWCSISENHKHAFESGLKCHKGESHPISKLSEADVLKIRESAKYGWTMQDLAERYNVASSTISRIVHRKRWAHL